MNHVLAKGKKFLPPIRQPRCYSRRQLDTTMRTQPQNTNKTSVSYKTNEGKGDLDIGFFSQWTPQHGTTDPGSYKFTIRTKRKRTKNKRTIRKTHDTGNERTIRKTQTNERTIHERTNHWSVTIYYPMTNDPGSIEVQYSIVLYYLNDFCAN